METIVESSDIRIERLELGRWTTNAYIVICMQTGHSVLIDVPPGARTIIKSLRNTTPKYILLTHSHIDHISGLPALRARMNIPLAAHTADWGWLPFSPEMPLDDGDVISIGKLKIEVLHTPGHTPGSLCFKVGKYLISGDTIFPGGPGATESPAELRQIIKSIEEKIMVLPDETQIYPGHGESTTIKMEKSKFAIFSSRTHDPNLRGDVLWLSS